MAGKLLIILLHPKQLAIKIGFLIFSPKLPVVVSIKPIIPEVLISFTRYEASASKLKVHIPSCATQVKPFNGMAERNLKLLNIHI